MIRNHRTDNGQQGGVEGDQDTPTDGRTLTFMITIESQATAGISIIGSPVNDISIIRTIEFPIVVTNGAEGVGVSPNFFTYIQELIDSIKRRDHMKKELVRNKPIIYTKEMEPKECMVCMSDFKPKQYIRKLECDHEFHRKCIDKWLVQGNAKCPLCRKDPFKKRER